MLKQSLQYRLLQKLSPQQIQLMKLIQLPTQAFEERLKQEIEENPALDTGKEESEGIDDDLSNEYDDDDDVGNEKIEAEDINIDEYLSDDEIPSYKTQANNYSADDEEKNVPYAAGTTFHQSLKNQLNTFRLDEEERAIAEFLVGSIDDSGYIRREIIDLVDDLAFTANIFTTEEKVISILTKGNIIKFINCPITPKGKRYCIVAVNNVCPSAPSSILYIKKESGNGLALSPSCRRILKP
jgi:RNA polymerase sigma-54 factor